jgi:hypothetical protein
MNADFAQMNTDEGENQRISALIRVPIRVICVE